MAIARPPWPGRRMLFITVLPAFSCASSAPEGLGGWPALKGSSAPLWMCGMDGSALRQADARKASERDARAERASGEAHERAAASSVGSSDDIGLLSAPRMQLRLGRYMPHNRLKPSLNDP